MTIQNEIMSPAMRPTDIRHQPTALLVRADAQIETQIYAATRFPASCISLLAIETRTTIAPAFDRLTQLDA